jgi:hypothetical protein
MDERRHRNSVAIDPLRNSATSDKLRGEVARPSQCGLARLLVNPPSPSPGFVGTVHLEVMPNNTAGLDGITMCGVLSICKAGLFTGGWYVEEGLGYWD